MRSRAQELGMWVALGALLAVPALADPPARGPIQACQFLQANPKAAPSWTDSVRVLETKRGTVPGSSPEIVILVVTLQSDCKRTVYFDGVGPATPALWTPVTDETSWRLLSLACLSGRQAHALAPGARLRYSYSMTAEEEDMVVGLVLSVEGEEGWAVACPTAAKVPLRVAAASPSSADRLQAGREN